MVTTATNVTDRILEILDTGNDKLPDIYMTLRGEGWDEVQKGQFVFTNAVKGLGFTVTLVESVERISL